MRVVVDGTWGFASHAELTPAAAADDRAARGRGRPRAGAAEPGARRTRAPNRCYADVPWVSDYDVDPFEVPAADKIALLGEYSRRLLASDGVDHVTAGCMRSRSRRSTPTRRLVHHPAAGAAACRNSKPPPSTRRPGTFETMRTLAPPVGRGWEYVAGDGVWDWTDELARIPELLAEKVKAPSVVAGPTDLVIDPTNLWLTIHESIGHATEYDRAIGYEAAYAGTSFATPDKLGTLRYGTPIMHVTADRTDGTVSPPSVTTTKGCERSPGIWCATGCSSATSSTGRSRRGSGWRAPTAARTPTPPTTSRSSGWPTCRCSPIPTPIAAPTT